MNSVTVRTWHCVAVCVCVCVCPSDRLLCVSCTVYHDTLSSVYLVTCHKIPLATLCSGPSLNSLKTELLNGSPGQSASPSSLNYMPQDKQ